MYWSSLRAIEYFKELTNDDVPIANTMYNTLNSKLIIPDVYSEYNADDLWSSVLGKNGTIYKSYLLGMNFRSPYDWELSSSGYKYAKSHFFLKPDRYNGYKNSKVGSTILLLANVNYNNLTLLEHMNSMIKEHQTVEKVEVDLSVEKKPFTIQFQLQPYNSDQKLFYSLRATDSSIFDQIKVNQTLNDVSFYSPGTGMAPSATGKYESLILNPNANHYIIYFELIHTLDI
jgi:hypothetical protein